MQQNPLQPIHKEDLDSGLALSVEGISKSISSRKLFSDLSFSLNFGRLMLVTGPNGCGKSTLLRCLAGVQNLDSGNVQIYSPPSSADKSEGNLSYLSHQSSLYPYLSVDENLKLFAKVAGKNSCFVDELIEGFKLNQYRWHKIDELSEGMKKRTSIARAWLNTPGVLLLDEPLTSLDQSSRETFLTQLELQLSLGSCILIVTHYPEAFSSLSRGCELKFS